MNGSFDFSGKKAVITGAAGIFGSWISKAFLVAGADVWLVDRDADKLQTLALTLSCPGRVRTSVTDLRSEAAIVALHEEVADHWRAPDFLVNNAGIYPNNLMLDLDTSVWDEVMELNVRAPFLMTKYSTRLMIRERIAGAIVNIISRSAKIPRVGAVHYAASKAALEVMTRGHSLELAKYQIRVNAVSPGFAPGSEVSYLSSKYIDAMNRKIPLGRTSGPDDAPQAVLFLCSDNASFITGSSLYVDGGNTAGDFGLPEVKREA